MDTISRDTSAAPGPRPGDTVLGCFRLERQIGAGSFATAYLAEQLGTDRRAVVKLPHPHLLRGPHGAELRRRFDAEAKAATRAKHPNLVTVYLVGETHYGVPAIAMEHVVGESLSDRLIRTAPLPTDELVAIGSQLADALATLHAAGIVHRDLSPANVLVTEQPDGGVWVKLLDFGVAKLLDAPSRTLGPMGTPGYLAPEQLLGSVTPRADVFSLGALLWWAITGREREDDYSDGSLRRSLGRRVGPDPCAYRADAPPELAQLIGLALIPDPQLRPSMAEFLLAWRAASTSTNPGSSGGTLSGRERMGRERVTTAHPQLVARVAVILSNPVMRAQVSSYLRERHAEVVQANPRELGRASPGEFHVAVLDEELPEVGTTRFVTHLCSCYPELIVVVVGFDDRRRHECLVAGAKAFVRMPDDLELLSTWLELGAETLGSHDDSQSTVEPEPRLRASLIERMLIVAPQQLAASLDVFIGCVPEWIARIERNLERSSSDLATRACRELIVGAESVGASELASLARATCERLAADDIPSARALLAASEREYLQVFQEAFSLLNHINAGGAHS